MQNDFLINKKWDSYREYQNLDIYWNTHHFTLRLGQFNLAYFTLFRQYLFKDQADKTYR